MTSDSFPEVKEHVGIGRKGQMHLWHWWLGQLVELQQVPQSSNPMNLSCPASSAQRKQRVH